MRQGTPSKGTGGLRKGHLGEVLLEPSGGERAMVRDSVSKGTDA